MPLSLLLHAPLLLLAPPQTEAPWRLEVSVSTPRPISLPGPEGPPRAFWWCEVRVRNDSGAARPLALSGRLLLDRGPERPALFAPDVEEAIEASIGRPVENLVGWSGEIAPGEGKRGVAIFSGVDRVADRLEVRIGGAAAAVRRAGTAWYAETVEHATVFERPGEDFHVWSHPVRKASAGWVVVSSRKFRG